MQHGKTPLYVRVMDRIRRDIQKGVFTVGDKIYTESEICKRHHVSRITAIRAIRELVTEGLLTRQQGRGTFVANITPVGVPGTSVSKTDVVVINDPTSGVMGSITEHYSGRIVKPAVIFAADFLADTVRLITRIQTGLLKENIPVCVESFDGNPDMLAERIAKWSEYVTGAFLIIGPHPGVYPDGAGEWIRFPDSIRNANRVAGGHVIVLRQGRWRTPLPANLLVDSFLSDAAGSMMQAVRHLTARGRDRIGFIGHSPDTPGSVALRDMFRDAVGERMHGDWVFLDDFTEPMNMALRAVTTAPVAERPNAFIVQDDTIAMGLTRILDSVNCRVPEDMSILCLRETGGVPVPGLTMTVMRPPMEEWADMTVRAILSRRENRSEPTEAISPSSVIIRG